MLVLALIALGLAAAAGVAYATTGADHAATTKIRACRSKSSGLLRVVSQTAKCRTDEALLTWNVQGPAGLPGAAGPKGDSGARRHHRRDRRAPARAAGRVLPGGSELPVLRVRPDWTARRASRSTPCSLRTTARREDSTSTRTTR